MLTTALLALPWAALANSSWRWLTKTRPWDILPFVVAVTLLLEILAVWTGLGQKRFFKVAGTVTAANLLSFAAPYAYEWVMTLFDKAHGMSYSFLEHLDHWPVYTVGVVYLLMTLAVEVPVVYRLLHADAKSEKRLLLTIVLANAATTAFAAFMEHMATRGTW